jgi:hypothetical protein
MGDGLSAADETDVGAGRDKQLTWPPGCAPPWPGAPSRIVRAPEWHGARVKEAAGKDAACLCGQELPSAGEDRRGTGRTGGQIGHVIPSPAVPEIGQLAWMHPYP